MGDQKKWARGGVAFPLDLVRSRLAEADARVAARVAVSAPPEAMSAAPASPARGPMRLVPNWEVTRGGIRRQDGAHWQVQCLLSVMNAQALARAEARGVGAVLPFSAGQIAVAGVYRGLVEWRAGSAIRCSSLEAGRGGSGSGVFIDSYIESGLQLGRMIDAIGGAMVMVPRRHMDRGNARGAISARRLVDMVLVEGVDLSGVLRAHGWVPDGLRRKEIRAHLVAALDRMQGWD